MKLRRRFGKKYLRWTRNLSEDLFEIALRRDLSIAHQESMMQVDVYCISGLMHSMH